MSSWAKFPEIDQNNKIVINCPKELTISPNQLFKINLGLNMVGLPNNYIVKLFSHHTDFYLISKIWLPDFCEELSLTIVTKTELTIKSGEPLCHIQMLPIHLFLSGYYFPSVIRNCLRKKFKKLLFAILCFLSFHYKKFDNKKNLIIF